MLTIFLINDDGSTRRFEDFEPLRVVLEHLKRNDIHAIVMGEIIDADGFAEVAWEKQFNAITGMPSSFGEERQ